MKTQIRFNLRQSAMFFCVVSAILLQVACLPFPNFQKVSQNPRNAQSRSNPTQNFSNQPRQEELAVEFNLKAPTDVFRKEIYTLLIAKDFKSIEKIASEVRKSKERVLGGYWKIELLYDAVATIYADFKGQKVSDEMWKNRLELLKQWKETSPNSITSRTAFAKGNFEYGWFIRGAGFSNTVSEENKATFQKQLEITKDELLEAYTLIATKSDDSCPGWYREMLYLGVAVGLSPEKFDELFEEAINSEPNYLQFYLLKSLYLTPRWGGNVNEWKKFVDELPSKLATLETDEADIIYFVVVAGAVSDSSLPVNWATISKEKIKKGFDDLDRKYQTDNYRLNQYAYICVVTMDFPAAQQAFKRIGDQYDKRIWGEQTFNMMKDMAEKGATMAKK